MERPAGKVAIVTGSVLCTKYTVVPMTKQNNGAILNFSSIYALIGNDDISAYHATKGAAPIRAAGRPISI